MSTPIFVINEKVDNKNSAIKSLAAGLYWDSFLPEDKHSLLFKYWINNLKVVEFILSSEIFDLYCFRWQQAVKTGKANKWQEYTMILLSANLWAEIQIRQRPVSVLLFPWTRSGSMRVTNLQRQRDHSWYILNLNQFNFSRPAYSVTKVKYW
jgi:hypothetical protein